MKIEDVTAGQTIVLTKPVPNLGLFYTVNYDIKAWLTGQEFLVKQIEIDEDDDTFIVVHPIINGKAVANGFSVEGNYYLDTTDLEACQLKETI